MPARFARMPQSARTPHSDRVSSAALTTGAGWLRVRLLSCALLGWALATAGTAQAVERVTFTDSRDQRRSVVGEALAEARDGGLMLQADDGRIWTVQPDQLIGRTSDPHPLEPIDADEAARRLLAEMPEGFRIYSTDHYTICHNTSDTYVRSVGSLFEQLYRGFYSYWKNQDWELREARFPLTALVFADRASFVRYAQPELGDAVENIIGYYNLETNRMTIFDLPNAERKIATIVHEATHQLAYNSGLQQRFADNPMWVSEGLAVFFESPDFASLRGWRGVGRVNRLNLMRFRHYAAQRPADSLITLLSDDARFRQSATAVSAYAESWALNYFLLKMRRPQYVAYLKQLSQRPPLEQLQPRERLEQFQAAIGLDLQTLDRQFMIYMSRVR